MIGWTVLAVVVTLLIAGSVWAYRWATRDFAEYKNKNFDGEVRKDDWFMGF